MGWTDVRVRLLAAGARITKEPSVHGINAEGDPVQIVRLEVLRAQDLPLLTTVVAVLERHTLRSSERGSTFVRFESKGLKAFVSTVGSDPDKVLEIELEFECTAQSNADLPRWSAIVESLSSELNLSPINCESLVGFDRAEDAIRATRTWKEFSDRFGWNR